MKSKMFRILKIAIVVMMILAIIFCFAVSVDFHHLDTCHEHHCMKCTMIHMAQSIMHITVGITVNVISILLISRFFCAIYKLKISILVNTLITQRVQFNE